MSFSSFFRKKSDKATKDSPMKSNSKYNLNSPPDTKQNSDGVVSDLKNCDHVENSETQINLGLSRVDSFVGAEMGDLGVNSAVLKYPSNIRSSQLSKTLDQILHDKDALAYFIQYLETCGAVSLVKFWLDADSFHASSFSRISTCSLETRTDAKEPEESQSLTLAKSTDCTRSTVSVTAHGHGERSVSREGHLVNSQIITACDSASPHVSDGACISKSNCVDSRVNNIAAENDNAVSSCSGSLPSTDVCSDRSTANSIEICKDSLGASGQNSLNLSSQITSDLSETSMHTDTLDREKSFEESLRKSIERDAVIIFTKYLSPDSRHSIGISDQLRTETVRKICGENQWVDPNCFADCQKYVMNVMEKEHFPGFLQSAYQCKHQLEILTGNQLHLVDILYNETSLSYFTEFMEEEKALNVLQCFLDLDNFQHHLLMQQNNYNGTEAQDDAIIIYDKYFSLQATRSLRFDDRVRLDVESNICREEGPLPNCFALPRALILQKIEQTHFPVFLKSDVYYKYLVDLINTVHAAQDMPSYRRKRTGSDASSEKSLESQSNESISSKNTLLAMDTSSHLKKAMNKVTDNMRIDNSLFNPDNLWHRPNAGSMKFGRVDPLGQFISEFDPDPDYDKKKSGFTFSRKKDKMEEDLALQVAQKILEDVNSATCGSLSELELNDYCS